MEWLRLLQQAIDYMEEHLLEKINYEDVAKAVHMSPYNFHRTFSLMSGMTANEYIRKRRLSLAGQELQLTETKVIDLALKYGYETPESFTKAFSRFHGVSPRAAKEKGTGLCLFNRLVIKISLEGGKMMEYRIEEMGEQKFIARVRQFENLIINNEEDNKVPGFWDECQKLRLVEKIRDLHPEGKKDLYGLCSPAKKDDKFFNYGIGVLVGDEVVDYDEEELVKEGFQVWKLQPTTYIVFPCYGTGAACIREVWERFYKEFLPQSGYEALDETDFEYYPQKGKPGMFCEVWIPVKKR